jgi:hypothetical protein
MKSFFLLISLIVFLFGAGFLFAASEDNPNVSDSWLNAAMRNIEKKEYEPSLQELDYRGEGFANPKFHLANRANNLRAYFDENGMELMERIISEEEKWNLKIKSIEVTGGEKKKIFSDLDVAINGDNIVCAGGGIEIIYSNSENGIEQNVIIKEKDEIEGIDFIIEAENLNVTQEKDRFVLKSKENEIIYRIYKIEDADGKEVSYSLSNAEDKLKVSLDDWEMVFPVIITANITSRNPSAGGLTVSASAKDRGISETPDLAFGVPSGGGRVPRVSSAGDVNGDGYSDVIVGCRYYHNGQNTEGGAFVYYGSVSGLDTIPVWSAESNQEEAYFGHSISSAGDVNGDGYSDVIVGAPQYDNTGVNYDEGRAYVFYGSSSGLSSSADRIYESDQYEAHFGSSVSGAGDVNGDGYSDVIVGAPWYDPDGRGYAYYGSASGLPALYASWTVGSPGINGSSFGGSVSGAGDVNGDGYSDVIIGDDNYANGESGEGAAYVYHGSSGGLSASPDWQVESDEEIASLGGSVSGAGDVNGDGYSDVIVGAVHYGEETVLGKVHIYYGGFAGLSSLPGWTLESDSTSFGASSAGDVNGDGYSDVIVGAPVYNDYNGIIFVHKGGPLGPSLSPDWTAESPVGGFEPKFGASISTAGDVNGDGYSDVIVGATTMAFVYHGSSSGPSTESDWSKESNQANAYFGCSVSSAGDVNGDGYSDVIIGAYGYNDGGSEVGRAYVYHGNSPLPSASPNWTAQSDQEDAHFGVSVSGAGDVNGDGYSDVIVGATTYDDGQMDEGAVFVYHGSSSGLSTSHSWTAAEADQAFAAFGGSVSSAGDVNGDGYSDVIVGAWGFDEEGANRGVAFVYQGSSTGLSASSNWSDQSDQAGAEFGISVSGAGDVNGDGYSDVIVGAHRYDKGENDEGAVFVYNGSPSGLSSLPNWTAESNQADSRFGASVSSAGDVNGDGYSDVIVGAYYYSSGQTNEGAAFVYNGSSSGLSGSPDWTDESNQAGAYFGTSVSSAGDVNGDRYSDVVIGANYYTNGESYEGRAFIYNGSPWGLSTVSPDWTAEPNQAGAFFGNSVSSAGDVNGDGYSDVIVGAYNYANGQTGEGGAFLYYGNEGGLSLVPTQSTADGSHLVQLGNLTGTSGVQLNILGRTPGGRGRVKLQWEVKELGQLFDEAFGETIIYESASWYDTDVDGVEISEDVTSLSAGTAYHWRVRLLYAPLYYEGSLHSRWLSIGPNGWNETDFITTDLSGIEDNPGKISSLQLSVFPAVSTNIFSISFYVSEEETKEDINLKVYNKAGIMVRNLFKGRKPAGTHTITLNGDKLANDIYFVSLKKGKKEQLVRKVVLLR